MRSRFVSIDAESEGDMRWLITVEMPPGSLQRQFEVIAPTASDAITMFREARHHNPDYGNFFYGKDAAIVRVEWKGTAETRR